MSEDNHEMSYQEVLKKYAALTPRQKKALERLALRSIEQRKAMFERENKRARAFRDKTIWTKEFRVFGESFFGPWELIKGLALYVFVGFLLLGMAGGLLESVLHWIGN